MYFWSWPNFLTCYSFTGRTGSLYIVVLITVERYLVVTHPLKMKIYMSVYKTRVVASLTCLVAVLSSLPRYFSVSLEVNQHFVKHDITQLEDFPYLFHSTWLGLLFFKRMVWLGRLHFLLDFLLPLPILLVLNVMLFVKVWWYDNSKYNLILVSCKYN